MDTLRQVVEAMNPGENVSPDFSSYGAMVSKWRGSKPPPTDIDVAIKVIELTNANALVKYIEDRKIAFSKTGITDRDMIMALWDKANGDDKEFDRINAIIANINTTFPKPV